MYFSCDKFCFFCSPSRLQLIPWYGRLVYDGVVAGPAVSTEDLRATVASDRLTATLKQAIKDAKREGRVIQGLAQLEEEEEDF